MSLQITSTIPSHLPVLVSCATCGHVVPRSQAVRYEIIEAIDGDQANMSAANIRHTGIHGYECDDCLEAECRALEEVPA